MDDMYNTNTNHKQEKIEIIADDNDKLCDIREFKEINKASLKELIINNSSLSNLQGLSSFINILSLNLSGNSIKSISIFTKGLNKLEILKISCNCLTSVSGVENLVSIREADFSHNKITDLTAFADLSLRNPNLLQKVALEDNLIDEENQLLSLSSFNNLEILLIEVDESTNPVCCSGGYIDVILSNFKSLLILNNQDVNSYRKRNFASLNRGGLGGSNNINPTVNHGKTKFFNFNKSTNDNNPFINNLNLNVNPTNIDKSLKQNQADFMDLKYKNFLSNNLNNLKNQQDEIHLKSLAYLKEENKNLALNIQELFKDNKLLIFKLEKLESNYLDKENDFLKTIKGLKQELSTYKLKSDENDLSVNELKNKAELRLGELNQTTKKLEELRYDYNELNSRFSLMKSDYDYSLIEKEKLNKRNQDLVTEIKSLKQQIYSNKESFSKEEEEFSEQLERKNRAVKELNEKISNLEHKNHTLLKQLNDKALELDSQEERIMTLTNQISKITKVIAENEKEVNDKYEKEKQLIATKHKEALSEVSLMYENKIKQKQEEFLEDMMNLDKRIKEKEQSLNEQIKHLSSEKERSDSILLQLKEELRNFIVKDEKTSLELSSSKEKIANLEGKVTELSQEGERVKLSLQTKVINLESELKEIFNENKSLEETVKALKSEVKAKEEECGIIKEEQASLRKEVKFHLSEKEKLDEQIKLLKAELSGLIAKTASSSITKKVNELEETISLKNLLLEDQSKQIIDLKAELAKQIDEVRQITEGKSKQKEQFHNKLSKKEKEIEEFRLMLEETKTLAEEFEAEILKVREEYESEVKLNSSLKQIIEAKDNELAKLSNDLNALNDKINSKSLEVDEKVVNLKKADLLSKELQEVVGLRERQIREIVSEFNSFKEEKNKQIEALTASNTELLNDLKAFIELREKEKKQLKTQLLENFSKFADLG